MEKDQQHTSKFAEEQQNISEGSSSESADNKINQVANYDSGSENEIDHNEAAKKLKKKDLKRDTVNKHCKKTDSGSAFNDFSSIGDSFLNMSHHPSGDVTKKNQKNIVYNGALLDQMGVTGKNDNDSSRSNSPPAEKHRLNMDDTPGSTNVMMQGKPELAMPGEGAKIKR